MEAVDEIQNVVVRAAEETLGKKWVGGIRKRHYTMVERRGEGGGETEDVNDEKMVEK